LGRSQNPRGIAEARLCIAERSVARYLRRIVRRGDPDKKWTGQSLWSRTWQNHDGNPNDGKNWLPYDDCGAGGTVVSKSNTSLNFAGILSTPVIDLSIANNSGSTGVVFLAAQCQTSSVQESWYLHEIDLATGYDMSKIQISGSAPGSNDADDLNGGTIAFNGKEENQRAALLDVNSSNFTTHPLIYVPFGVATKETSASTDPYHGWVLGYTLSSGSLAAAMSGTTQFAFLTTPNGCGPGGNTTHCNIDPNTGNPPCDCLVQGGAQNAPTWGGHGAGIWMSGRGPAADTGSSGVSHAFLGIGNGGFQQDSNHNPLNWGESIVDFRLSSTNMDITPSAWHAGTFQLRQTETQTTCGLRLKQAHRVIVPLGKLYTERLVPADENIRMIVAQLLRLRALAPLKWQENSPGLLLPRPSSRDALYRSLRRKWRTCWKRMSAHTMPTNL
jgi:hypothetical protein